jgi:molybdenum cofactor guanylyltransferase
MHYPFHVDDLGAVVLCGGRSTRMGRPKALLPFGGEVLLQRVLGRIAPAVGPIAVVAAPDQTLPALPAGVLVVRDPVEGEGPLAGIAVGLAALADRARFAYVTATDAPFVTPAFVRRMRALCDEDAAVPWVDDRYHPLAAVYATHFGAIARELVASGERRATVLCARPRVRAVAAADLSDLAALRNLNTPEDYQAALRDAGLA